ncbi:hypothetical protein GQ42DRAFT_15375 [Ramicandelaber brevisporus]|nr:hypothetical protein GQ42DRAFT_15375 [Ramicandelaber brevisporus]
MPNMTTLNGAHQQSLQNSINLEPLINQHRVLQQKYFMLTQYYQWFLRYSTVTSMMLVISGIVNVTASQMIPYRFYSNAILGIGYVSLAHFGTFPHALTSVPRSYNSM